MKAKFSAWLIMLLLLLFATGCERELVGGLSQSEAHALAHELENHGIAVSLEEGDAGWRLQVADQSLPRARALMVAMHLPEDAPAAADEGLLGPSPSARLQAEERALEGRLVESLERLDCVVDARVHLARPATSWKRQGPQAPAECAALLLVEERCEPAALTAKSQTLLAGAVPELEAEGISVIIETRPVADEQELMSQLGPWLVSSESASSLRWSIFGLIGLLFAALVGLAAVARRRQE